MAARRFNAIQAELTADLGSNAALSAAERMTVANTASLILESENLQRRQQRGQAIDADVLVRVTNAAARALTALKAKRSPKGLLTGREALDSYLKTKHGDPVA